MFNILTWNEDEGNSHILFFDDHVYPSKGTCIYKKYTVKVRCEIGAPMFSECKSMTFASKRSSPTLLFYLLNNHCTLQEPNSVFQRIMTQLCCLRQLEEEEEEEEVTNIDLG